MRGEDDEVREALQLPRHPRAELDDGLDAVSGVFHLVSRARSFVSGVLGVLGGLAELGDVIDFASKRSSAYVGRILVLILAFMLG